MTIKLFISYSHKDEEYRKALETHLTLLKRKKLIETWHDRKMGAGASISSEILKNMREANIILLLFSPAFIESEECKKEMDFAKELKKEKKAMIIPIILRNCAWKDEDGMADTLALPEDGKPISNWKNEDSAWNSVYNGIKNEAKKIQDKILPQPNREFAEKLISKSSLGYRLDKMFVYPDLLNHDAKSGEMMKRTVDSEKLTDINSLSSKHVLIDGAEQIGKTSLCNMLYVSYLKKELRPVMIHGSDIAGKANIKLILNKAFQAQYQGDDSEKYWNVDIAKRVLLIDDIHEIKLKRDNYVSFIESIKETFGYVIVFIDNMINLSDKTISYDCFAFFKSFSMEPFGHAKRDEILRKYIGNDYDGDFDPESQEQIMRLERDTQHINTIIGANIVPSYPVFITSTIATLESLSTPDMSKTSYGHCYHAMITVQLHRSEIKSNDMNGYFNFLKYLAYYMFEKKEKSLSEEELERFYSDYSKERITEAHTISNLEKSGIIKREEGKISFRYIYIYYYFVAQYIAENIATTEIKKHIEALMKNINRKDNANIIIFTAHHSHNEELLEYILVNSIVILGSISEATLAKSETKFIANAVEKLENMPFPPENHNHMKARNKALQIRDKNQPTIDKVEESLENDNDEDVVAIVKSAKSIEIIGQIMKNQYGSFKKEKLRDLFEQGKNVGLRVIKIYIDSMNKEGEALDEVLRNALIRAAKEKGEKLTESEARDKSRRFIATLSHIVIYSWLMKIVHSLGYEKLIGIADEVHDKAKQKTVASKLINFSIHAWYEKGLEPGDIKSLINPLVNEFQKDNNHAAVQLLHSAVAHYLYMRKVKYSERQSIEAMIKVPAKGQIIKHGKIYHNKK